MRELLQQALDALEEGYQTHTPEFKNVITALRAALAQPAPEPVAWRIFDGEGGYDYRDEEPELFDVDWAARYGRKYEPLYATPQQAQPAPAVPVEPPFDFAEWHINLMMLADAYWEASAAARHRYREKLRIHALNAGRHWKARAMIAAAPGSAPAAPAVPVSWERLRTLMDGIPTREEFIGGQRQQYVAKEAVMGWLYEGQLRAEREAALSAAPAVREPLTDAEITSMFDSAGIEVADIDFLYLVIGMVERHHHIEAKGTEA